MTRGSRYLWLFGAGVGVLLGGLALFAAGGWSGAYRAGEVARFETRVAEGSASHLRVEKVRGPLFGWMHAQYLPPGEVLEVPLASGPVSVLINFWDPGLYRVVITGSTDRLVRVGLPAARFWGLLPWPSWSGPGASRRVDEYPSSPGPGAGGGGRQSLAGPMARDPRRAPRCRLRGDRTGAG